MVKRSQGAQNMPAYWSLSLVILANVNAMFSPSGNDVGTSRFVGRTVN